MLAVVLSNAIAGTTTPTQKAPTQPTADRGRNGLGEGFFYDCFTAR